MGRGTFDGRVEGAGTVSLLYLLEVGGTHGVTLSAGGFTVLWTGGEGKGGG